VNGIEPVLHRSRTIARTPYSEPSARVALLGIVARDVASKPSILVTETTKIVGVNRTSLESVNALLAILVRQEGSMVIYPVPVAVTQARVQLAIDETAKAPPNTISSDVQNVLETQTQAEREALVDRKA
jgi:hypothetical protein